MKTNKNTKQNKTKARKGKMRKTDSEEKNRIGRRKNRKQNIYRKTKVSSGSWKEP